MTLEDISVTAAALAVVVDELGRRTKGLTEKQAAVDSAIPVVVNTLVANSRIRPNEKQAAAAMLKTHQGCLDMICRLARHRPASQPPSIGEPVAEFGVKTAGVRPKDVIPPVWQNPAAIELRRRLGLLP